MARFRSWILSLVCVLSACGGGSSSLVEVEHHVGEHWLRRRQAVEPAIGHLKSDHRMDRCWLQGALGDALHSISCAAGYNLRWLLRAIARLGLGAVFLRLLQAALSLAQAIPTSSGAHERTQVRV